MVNANLSGIDTPSEGGTARSGPGPSHKAVSMDRARFTSPRMFMDLGTLMRVTNLDGVRINRSYTMGSLTATCAACVKPEHIFRFIISPPFCSAKVQCSPKDACTSACNMPQDLLLQHHHAGITGHDEQPRQRLQQTPRQVRDVAGSLFPARASSCPRRRTTTPRASTLGTRARPVGSAGGKNQGSDPYKVVAHELQ